MYKKYSESIVNFFKEDRKYIWTFLFSQLFPSCFFITNNGKVQNMENIFNEYYNLGETLFGVFLIFLIVGIMVKYFFGKSYKKILLTLIALNFIGNTLELIIYLNFGTQITPEMFNILFESNKNEATEFLKFYMNYKLIFVLGYFVIGLLMLFKIEKNIFLKGTFLSIILILVGVNYLNIPRSNYIKKTYIYKSIGRSFTRYKKALKETKELMATYDERFKDVKVLDETKEGTYVLIIGESFSRNHSSLYGYPRDTSPNMKKRFEKGELFKFNDVVSPHHYTRDTLLKLVTDYSYDSDKKFAESTNIIDLFKKAGYKTFWLSNQEDFVYNGAGLSSVANRADETEFTEKSMSDTKNKLDDSYLLPLLDKALTDKSKKKFIVIHLFGSHAAYNSRYPKEFEYFDLNSEERYFSKLQKKNKKVVNEYHNALRYNDYIVENMIQKIDKNSKNSFVMYISDHGQVVYDENIDFVGSGTPDISKKSLEIPMMVWTSEYYREKNREKIKRIIEAEDNKFSSEDIIYPLIDLSNFKYDGYKAEKNLLDKNFIEKDRRVSIDGIIY